MKRWQHPDMPIAVDWEIKHQFKQTKNISYMYGMLEPLHKKTNNLHMRKQSRRSAVQSRLISVFVSTIPLLLKSKISSLWPACTGWFVSDLVGTQLFVSCTGSFRVRQLIVFSVADSNNILFVCLFVSRPHLAAITQQHKYAFKYNMHVYNQNFFNRRFFK